jgi:hypothetical protein
MRSIARALLTATVAVLLLAPAALAAEPTIERIPVDDTRVFPAGTRCAFEVDAHRVGTLTVMTWTDDNGDIVRQTFTWNGAKIEYVNPANGKSVTTLLAGPAIYEFLGDGTALLTIPGNDQAVVMPGQGFIDGRTGLSVQIVDAITGEVFDVLKLAGHQTAPFPTGCQALA